MDILAKHNLLVQVAQMIADKSSRTELLTHHQKINDTVTQMLSSRGSSPKKKSLVSKDNPLGDPFFKKKKTTFNIPQPVSSKMDRALDNQRASMDAASASFD